MVTYTTTILKFEEQGEKTGWTYIEIPPDIAEAINPGCRKSYRVKGMLDKHNIKGVSILPMGSGSFIIPLKADLRKAIHKNKGAMLQVSLELDATEYQLHPEFMACLEEVPEALERFNAMPRSHQNYYSKWIESAKTAATQEKRIVTAVSSLAQGLNYAEMIRAQSKKNQP
jgi:hypothetical protein